MSQDFMDPEIFADFIVEAKEHLETIEPNLLELEKAPDNLGLLNEIFRPMHSLKGASGFLGLMTINNLAHKAENILDELRKGAMVVTSEIMDTVLEATDALRQLIDNLETTGVEGEVDTLHIIERFESMMESGSAPAPQAVPDASAGLPADDSAAASDDQADTPPDVAAEAPAPASEPVREPAATAPAEPLPDGEPYSLTAFGEGHLNDFLEEARELIENMNAGLLELEKDPTASGDLVNDIFRYFHNLKGNSGIIGFRDVNTLTHEAETLLNRVRKNEMKASHALIDLLLNSVDLMETLINRVDVPSSSVTPVDITPVLSRLQNAVTKNIVEPLPSAEPREAAAPAAEPEAVEAAPAPAAEESAQAGDAEPGEEFDRDDVIIFASQVKQHMGNIGLALENLAENSEQPEYIDGMYRSLVSLQNACGYMALEETKVYAERTAGLVDQARSAGIGFDAMLDLLNQEIAILGDMLVKEVEKMGGDVDLSPSDEEYDEDGPSGDEAESEAPKEEPQTEVAEKPAAEPEPEPAPAPKPEPAPKPAPKPQPAPKPAPKAEAKPAPAAQAKPAAAAQKGAPADQNKPKVSSTIRVDHEKLDHLMNLIGELIINRNRYWMLARNLEQSEDSTVLDIAQNLTETTYAMARISDDLQDTIMNVRMVPVSTVFTRFPRLVRDLSRKSGKQVELILEGEETELDKSVVEVIGDPLVHLIRNSVDHGIESEGARAEAGKPEVGKVWLRAYHRGNSVAIEIEDDGKGIDPEKMREVAVSKGVISADEAKNLDDREAMELIFAPGFSSAEKITDISGRGVGMDVVRTNIKNLKGSVTISSEVGKGTKFTLSLPLTLAIIDALMVKVSGETFAIPLDAVSETTKLEAKRLTDVNDRKAVTLRGEVLGIVNLSDLLALPKQDEPEILSVVVVQDNERRLGIVVDRLLERQEIVIKPLGSYLGDQRGISGATIMGDGSVVLILDPHEIYMMATSKAV